MCTKTGGKNWQCLAQILTQKMRLKTNIKYLTQHKHLQDAGILQSNTKGNCVTKHTDTDPICALEKQERIKMHVTAGCKILASKAYMEHQDQLAVQEHLYQVRTRNSEVKVGHTSKGAGYCGSGQSRQEGCSENAAAVSSQYLRKWKLQ